MWRWKLIAKVLALHLFKSWDKSHHHLDPLDQERSPSSSRSKLLPHPISFLSTSALSAKSVLTTASLRRWWTWKISNHQRILKPSFRENHFAPSPQFPSRTSSSCRRHWPFRHCSSKSNSAKPPIGMMKERLVADAGSDTKILVPLFQPKHLCDSIRQLDCGTFSKSPFTVIMGRPQCMCCTTVQQDVIIFSMIKS